MDVSDARRLKELENENGKLKKLLAEAHLDIDALKGVFGVKKARAPQAKRPTTDRVPLQIARAVNEVWS